MITIRPAAERGHFNHGWLETYHTFSFADYWDPRNMSFGPLRVINEDRVAPAMGFPTHPHRDMEIITYVLEGELSHKDSMGNGSTMRPGEVQRMSAGTGVRHSEFNSSETDPLHLLQIWIIPGSDGFPPSYEQKDFPTAEKLNRLRLVASPDGAEGSVTIHQDARVFVSVLEKGKSVSRSTAPERKVWIQVARGSVLVNGKELKQGDGAGVEKETALEISSASDAPAEILLFDMA
jgi:redox-sensitive bicupin YhaK (pirin superfamily)